MLHLIQPVPLIEENIWDEEKVSDWSRSAEWPSAGAWPADPTRIPDADKQCDFCDDDTCACDNATAQVAPQIKSYRAKGLGLQAVASEPGGVAYEKGAFLGMFSGEIAPPKTYDNNQTPGFL
ncbi:hypothetical protein VD0002_g9695 [Verticillium dahliae]|uniref:Uncharacterized protein n=1 Tax=Verticillium dahliae TaxID=27337 RepID=A0AA44W9E8_VERDA|nr:hypothetical protein BJF96_g10365 [Verticillium dahliae]PNH41675.1 hypothetical protein VD0003_g9935 [Verticillium dahliae]PNH57463.1 hypothetical protein VD0002_g9695 [Verticillium dahliae]